MSLKKDELKTLISSRRDILKVKTDDISVNTDVTTLISIVIRFADTTAVNAFAFHISEDDLKKLDFASVHVNLKDKILPELKLNNFFLVNNAFEIIEKTQYNPASSIEAREAYKEFSQNKHIVLLIFNKTYSLFHDGIELTNTTFTAEADLKKWESKRDISKLFEVIDEYKQNIKSRDVYFKFFAEKSILIGIFGDPAFLKKRNLLRNKPEGILRDDLKNFLKDNINRTFNFSRESLLDSNKRLDINTEDELGNYYFLEIKWVGKSIKPDASDEGFGFDETRPQEGLKQTLEYIAELNAMNKTVKLGCLVVFDARDTKTPFTYDFSLIDPALHVHKNCYHCIDDIHIENTNPI